MKIGGFKGRVSARASKTKVLRLQQSNALCGQCEAVSSLLLDTADGLML